MQFTPENTKGEKLTSRALKDECVFDAGYVVESETRTVDGKVKRFQNKTPISYVLAPSASGGGSSDVPGGGSSDIPGGGGTTPGEAGGE
jgi:hypothetical protein